MANLKDIIVNGCARVIDTIYGKLGYSITIQTNGTTQGTFNNTENKTINITPANIGASASNHTHSNYLTAHQSLAGYVPTSRTVNNKALTGNISLTSSDVGAVPVTFDHVGSTSGTAPYVYVWMCRLGNSAGYTGLALEFTIASRYNKISHVSMLISTGQYPYNSSSIQISKDEPNVHIYYVRTPNDSSVGYDYYDFYLRTDAWNILAWTIDKRGPGGTLQYTNKNVNTDTLPSGAIEVNTLYQLAGSYASANHNHDSVYQAKGSYAASSHTHNYAGSSSAGGAATSANKVNAAITFNNGGNGVASGTTFDGSTARTISYNSIGAAASGHNHDSSYAAKSHTHNYAGSSSAGGAATSANKVNAAITFNNGGSGAASGTTFDGSTARTISYNSIGAAASGHNHDSSYAAKSHTHNYAGSSSAGGAATSAAKLNTNAGDSTTPVYFSNGVPVACGGRATGATITSSWQSGNNWYRVWSDGWIEQGGLAACQDKSWKTINLNKAFTNTSYMGLCTAQNGYTNDAYTNAYAFQAVSTTQMKILSCNYNYSAWWYACGK